MSSLTPVGMQQLPPQGGSRVAELLYSKIIEKGLSDKDSLDKEMEELCLKIEEIRLQSMSYLNQDVQDLIRQFPNGANRLFFGPKKGYSPEMNNIPVDLLKLLLENAFQADRLCFRPSFDAKIFLGVPLEKVAFCLKHLKVIQSGLGRMGLDTEDMLRCEELYDKGRVEENSI